MANYKSCFRIFIGFIIFNALKFLIGVALIILGILFLTKYKHEFHFVHFSTSLLSIAFIAIGFSVIVLVIIGFYISRGSYRTTAIVHLIGLLLAFVALATLGIWGAVALFSGKIESELRAEINGSIASYNQTDKMDIDSQEMDWMQQTFSCCGLNSYDDWEAYIAEESVISQNKFDSVQSGNRSAHDVPDSCCKNVTVGCGTRNPRLDDINNNGCFQPFYKYLSTDLTILCAVACSLALFTLAANIFMLCACIKTKGDYSKLSHHF